MLQDTEIKLFECFQPQLANFNKRNLRQVVEVMGGKTFWIEEKLDGERIQLHKQGRNFRFFSRCYPFLVTGLTVFRKAKDYTYLYGTSLDDPDSSLTRFLKSAFVEHCEEYSPLSSGLLIHLVSFLMVR
jgi:DNA ligase-4